MSGCSLVRSVDWILPHTDQISLAVLSLRLNAVGVRAVVSELNVNIAMGMLPLTISSLEFSGKPQLRAPLQACRTTLPRKVFSGQRTTPAQASPNLELFAVFVGEGITTAFELPG